MKRDWIRMAASLLLYAATTAVPAHEATELYIPVGASPGVSGTLTDIGTIDSADAGMRTITVARRTVAITGDTRIYLDRSRLEQRNGYGDFSDLAPGRTVEVRYRDPALRRTALWVKVRIE